MKKLNLIALGLAAMTALPINAQNVKINGVGQTNRHDDGEIMTTQYLGWNMELQKSIFIVENGLYTMTWNGSTLTVPEKEPAVVAEDIKGDNDKEIWANNFNMMVGSSGAVYVNGKVVTIFSRDEQSTTDDQIFAVRKWDAKTGNLLSTEYRPKSDYLESAGMSYNPVDGKVYGLFYLTEEALGPDIINDPEYFSDEDDNDFGREGMDAGYAICTIDLATMKVTPVTKGLYYQNFVTFAINSEGRAFALTSGGSAGYEGDDGRFYNSDNKRVGAQLFEFDLKTGLMLTKPGKLTDPVTGETYDTEINIFDEGTGYCSQFRRQSACFSKSNPDKMYWNGYYNSGKGINDWGSWSNLSDREWRTNGKYDTALYEVDINTGEATRLSKIGDRWTFSALWVDGDDCSDGANIDIMNAGPLDPGEGAYITMNSTEGGNIWMPVTIGQAYRFFVEPAEGWTVHSVTFNGNELTVGTDLSINTPAINSERNSLVVVFEKNGSSAVAAANADRTRILADQQGLHITGAAEGTPVTVYTADGRQLSRHTIGASADVPLNGGALYIVKVGSKVVKVRL
jgi:hypothetical protein